VEGPGTCLKLLLTVELSSYLKATGSSYIGNISELGDYNSMVLAGHAVHDMFDDSNNFASTLVGYECLLWLWSCSSLIMLWMNVSTKLLAEKLMTTFLVDR